MTTDANARYDRDAAARSLALREQEAAAARHRVDAVRRFLDSLSHAMYYLQDLPDALSAEDADALERIYTLVCREQLFPLIDAQWEATRLLDSVREVIAKHDPTIRTES